MAVFTVSISDGTTLSSLAVSAGRGPQGPGWTGVSYDTETGRFTFTSNDGLGYTSDDITVGLDAAVAAAEAAQAAAEAAETNTINLFDQFGDQYLGPKASDPTADNDGDPLTDGDIYFNTTDNVLKFYSGTAWVAPEVIATTAASDAQTAQAAAEAAQSAAETSETNAAASASAASTSETNAAASASAAATSETNAATSETNAANSASAAATSETNAATSEANAAASASAAATSETNAAASFDSFDDRYLGAKASAPTTDNDGDPLIEGALYWNSTSNQLFIRDGSAWASASFSDANPSFDSITANTADINGNITATEGTFSRLNVGANLEWNASTDTYTANTTPSTVTKIHQGMKRCVLNDDGSVNYYLDPTDSTKKLDGTAANIDGTDGNVMVEIPRFYFRQVRNGSTLEWQISDVPLAGYQLHPAFFKNGEIVDFRYIGAYDACVYDDSAGTYIAGLNLDDNTGNIDTANDKLASVSGIYPMVGVTRSECRSLAANNGPGWRQQDFWLTCAVQMLYLVEFGDFNSQANLGDGNTNGGYISSSADQNESPHTIAGASNTTFGNASTDGTQPSAGAKPGTAYMSYRGIENFFGNPFTWVDGVNIGSGSQGDWHASNDDGDFADNTTTNYEFLVNSMPADGYVEDIADVAGAFIPSATGGSSSTYLSDFFSDDNGNTNRGALFGGNAGFGSRAGAFYWNVLFSSGFASRSIGARLSY